MNAHPSPVVSSAPPLTVMAADSAAWRAWQIRGDAQERAGRRFALVALVVALLLVVAFAWVS